MSQTRSTDVHFPPEILNQFITKLGSDDRRLLLPFLLASRQLHDLALPLLYESFTVTPEHGSTYPVPAEARELYFPSFFIDSDRLPLLYDTLNGETGQRLSVLTKAFSMHPMLWSQPSEFAEQTMKHIFSLLPHFLRLQRLSVGTLTHRERGLGMVIPQSVHITHLHINSAFPDEIVEILRVYPNLRVLSIAQSSGFREEPDVDCRGLSLPKLHTYSGPMSIWRGIYGTCPLVRSLRCISSESLPPMYPFYANLRTLSFNFRAIQAYYTLLPHLYQVEYLQMTMLDLADGTDQFIENLQGIPSPIFKYMAIHTMRPKESGVWDPTARSLFNKISSLVLIDITGPHWETATAMSFGSFRYTRSASPTPRIPPIYPLFGWWWHSVEKDMIATGLEA